jgi:hypothetical protein
METTKDSEQEDVDALYFHPNVSPHFAQWMSLTVCRPVVIDRSSVSPRETLVLSTRKSQYGRDEGRGKGDRREKRTNTRLKRYARPCAPLKFCSESDERRGAGQPRALQDATIAPARSPHMPPNPFLRHPRPPQSPYREDSPPHLTLELLRRRQMRATLSAADDFAIRRSGGESEVVKVCESHCRRLLRVLE